MPEATARPHRYRFGDFVIDERRGALQRDGEDVPLRPKSWDVLRHLVRHRGELVTKEALLETIWEGRVVTEGVLAKSVGEIRLALDDEAHELVRTVPRRGYLFEAPVDVAPIDSPPADGPPVEDDRPAEDGASPLVFQSAAATGVAAPGSEAAPNRASGSPLQTAPRGRMARSWPRGARAAVLLAAVIVLWSLAVRHFDAEPSGPGTVPAMGSIAVLPFLNLSNDADNEYFSDGIAEEVLNRLAKTPDLGVISRSSSFSFRDKELDVPSIAAQLDVGFVLEGSVRKQGNRIRVTAQLIDARSDTHLWSEVYEKELEDIFAIQDEISAAIVESLRDTIGLEADESPTTAARANPDAHDAYLRGRYLLARREVGGAVREFEKALSFDPEFARAHAQLAIAYQIGKLDLSDAEAAAIAAPHVEQAMALDPSIAEAHAAAGMLAWTEGDLEGALNHFEDAIQINPSYADVYTWMANLLDVDLGRYSEAFAMREKAAHLEPLSMVAMFNYTDHLIRRERFSEADGELEKLATMAPGLHALQRGLRLSIGGHWADGALGFLEALRIDPEFVRAWLVLPYWFALLGLEEEALAVGEEADPGVLRLLGKPRQAVAAAQAKRAEAPDGSDEIDEIGLALAGAGDYVGARPFLEALWQEQDGRLAGLVFHVDHAAALIAVRRAAGEEDKVADVLAAIRDSARRIREAGISTAFDFAGPDYEDGLADFLAGDAQRGLALIARAVEDGHFIPPGEAYLTDLYEHPDYARIRAMQEARQARERERFLAAVCAVNPYAAVWQPAEGTCDRGKIRGQEIRGQ